MTSSTSRSRSRTARRIALSITSLALLAASSQACSVPNDGQESGDETTTADDLTASQLAGRSLPAKTVALTFDDGPGARTEELSGWLKEEGIAAGFFMLGNAATGKADVLRRVVADGHVIGNHTFDHKQLTLSSTDPVSEVQKTDAILSPFFSGNMHMLRAPYGAWSSSVEGRLNAAGFEDYVGSIFWDVGGVLTDTHAADWDCWGHRLSIEDCGDRYIQEIHDRGDHGIVLMHDIHSNTVDMVKTVIVPKLKAQGFSFARVDGVPTIHAQLVDKGATPGPLAGTH
jgi:peptidoglycan/xylan/chitin deacetylase (PgdA/CDA1 family)